LDSFNTIKFYDDATLVASYTGADISPLLPTGNQSLFSASGYVEFSNLANFNKVVLGTGDSNAFEIDNISAGSVADSHVELSAPISGSLTVSDADIGDTLTASVVGDAHLEYNGSTTLPNNADVSALIAANAITFDTVTSNGGVEVLHWTYDPTNPDLDFLKSGDTLTITFTAQVNDGQVSVGNQPLTITLTGTETPKTSDFEVVNGTSGNDMFVNVGGNTTIFGADGQDTFVFNAGFGSATIGDFDVNKDTIGIDHTLVADISALLASAQAINSGHDTILTDAFHDTITLAGVTVAQIQAHQAAFHLV
jgi:fibronectin-binding autotransporter adhesin